MVTIILFLFTLLFAHETWGATIYVDQTIGVSTCGTYNVGARTCSGGSARAYLSLNDAVNHSGLARGDFIEIRAGIHTATRDTNFMALLPYLPASGTSRVTIQNFPSETATMRPSACRDLIVAENWDDGYWTIKGNNGGGQHQLKFDGINCTAGLVESDGASGIYIRGPGWILESLEVYNVPYSAFSQCRYEPAAPTNPCFVSDTTYRGNKIYNGRNKLPAWPVGIYNTGPRVLIEDNELYGISHSYAIALCPSSHVGNSCDASIVRRNEIHSTNYGGIVAYDAPNVQIYDNRFWDVGAVGILHRNSTGGMIYNNTAHHVGYYGWDKPGSGLSWPATWNSCIVVDNVTNAIVKNNIVYDCVYAGIELTSGTATFSNNMGGGGVSNANLAIVANPQLASASSGDLRLCVGANQPAFGCTTLSSAIDAGTLTIKAGSVVISSYNGTSRDIGWDETGATPPPTPTQNLVLALSGDNTVIDSSAYAHSASIVGGVTYDASGKYNQAFSFDGTTGYITIPSHSSLLFPNAYTLEAWVKPSALGNRPIFTRDAGANTAWSMHASYTGACGTNTPFGGFWNGSSFSYVCYSTPLTIGDWTHQAVTWDGTTLRLYINGSFITTGAAAFPIVQTAGQVRIGADMWGAFYSGLMDDIRIYDYALPQGSTSDPCVVAPTIGRDMVCPINPITPATPVGFKIGSAGIRIGAGGSLKVGN